MDGRYPETVRSPPPGEQGSARMAPEWVRRTFADMSSPPDASTTPRFVARGVSKRFGAVEALVDVDFEVSAGEVVALVGDNGAGKSTLIKAISGVQPADAGEFWFEGEHVDVHTPGDAYALGIAT